MPCSRLGFLNERQENVNGHLNVNHYRKNGPGGNKEVRRSVDTASLSRPTPYPYLNKD